MLDYILSVPVQPKRINTNPTFSEGD